MAKHDDNSLTYKSLEKQQAPSLKAAMRIFLRHWFAACLIVVLAFISAVIYSAAQIPKFKAKASILIENRIQSIMPTAELGLGISHEVTDAQRILARTTPVLKRAVEILNQKWSAKNAKQAMASVDSFFPLETLVEGQLLVLSCYDPDPIRAADMANAWVDAFVVEMTQRERADNKYTITFLEEQVPALQKKWYDEQVKLQEYVLKSKLNFKDGENSPIRQHHANLSQLLSNAQIRQVELHSEAAALERAKDNPSQILQLPRARKDEMIHQYESMLMEQEKKVREIETRYDKNAELVKRIEEPKLEIKELTEKALSSLADQVQMELRIVDDQVAGLSKLFEQAKTDLEDLNSKSAKFQELSFSADVARRQYEDALDRLNKSDLLSRAEYSYAKPWEAATVPEAPFLPKWPTNLTLGLVLGVLLAAGFIYLLEATDNTVHTDVQLQERLGVTTLGTIPRLEKMYARDPYHFVTKFPHCLPAESMRSLRMSLLLACGNDKNVVVLITSPGSNDGKTVIASNLAVALAEQGRKTLLIDGDLHKGTLSNVWGIKEERGLSELFEGSATLDEIGRSVGVQGLTVIPMGKRIDNPARLWEAETAEAVFAKARLDYSVTIIDAPCLLGLSDAQLISQKCDATLLVVRSRSTDFTSLQRTMDGLQRANAHETFFVVNGLDRADAEAAGYGYGYGYYAYGYAPKDKNG
jgi:capsular exopolysaccharide synthesis family protein